jgi:hypothetical protein
MKNLETSIDEAKRLAATPEQMASPLWRISNLYTIQSHDATGADAGPIPFIPTPEQAEVLHAIYVLGWEFIIIPKSRQLGMSTVLCIIILDSLLFGSSLQCSIVDKTEPDAWKKLSGKIKYGFQSLAKPFRSEWEILKSNDGEFTIKRKGSEETEKSTVYAAVSARGGTNHILFISEWGEVQLKDKKRSLEILTGSLPTADHPGCITICETTWKGGKTGELWPLVAAALKTPESLKGPKDPRVMFFGWWTNPNNSDSGDISQITAETHEYCEKAERMIGKTLTNAQRLWWQKTKVKLGIHMMSEHPTTMDECFEAPHEGAFFDAAGLKWQEVQIVPMEPRMKLVDITVQGRAAFAFPKLLKHAPFRIWEMPQDNESYLISCDFCVGKQVSGSSGKRDTHSVSVWKAGRLDPNTREYFPPMKVAALQPEDQSITHTVADRIRGLYFLYGECLVVPEINNMGNIVSQLEAIGVKNIWTQRTGADGAMVGEGKREEVKGWHTNTSTRKQMLDNLQMLVQQQAFIVSDPTTLHQMTVFVLDKHGKAQAAAGERDDHVTEAAIGLLCLPSATVYRSPGQRSLNSERPGFNPNWGKQDARGL